MRDMAILMLGEIIGAAIMLYVAARVSRKRVKEAMRSAAAAECEECAKIADYWFGDCADQIRARHWQQERVFAPGKQ